MTNFNSQKDYQGLLEYLTSLKDDFYNLPTAHSSKLQLTFTRIVLLSLPLIQNLEAKIEKDPKVEQKLDKIVK